MHILVKLKSALEEAGYTEEQWKELDEKTKKQYIKDHPNSKYAQKDKPAKQKTSKSQGLQSKEHEKMLKNIVEYTPAFVGELEFTGVQDTGNGDALLKWKKDGKDFSAIIEDYKSYDPEDDRFKQRVADTINTVMDSEEESENTPDWTENDTMTTEEAKEYWNEYHNSDPVLELYDSFEDWYKESKENGYIKDEEVEKEQYPYTDDKLARYTDYFGKNEKSIDRPKEYFSGELTIDNWEDKPAKDSYFKDEMSYIGQGIKDAIGANSSGRLDIKYADGEDKDNAFISIADKDTGIIYNVIIDSYGIDIMDEDMTDSYLAGEVENGYFEPNDLESVVQFLKKDILGNEDEDDYTEDDSEVMTTEEAKEYWKNNRTSDPILEDYDSFEDWYKESKENGYIKD